VVQEQKVGAQGQKVGAQGQRQGGERQIGEVQEQGHGQGELEVEEGGLDGVQRGKGEGGTPGGGEGEGFQQGQAQQPSFFWLSRAQAQTQAQALAQILRPPHRPQEISSSSRRL